MSDSYYRESVVPVQLGTQETTVADSVTGWQNGETEDATSKNYDLNSTHTNIARLRTNLCNKIVGDSAQVNKRVAELLIDDLIDGNLAAGDKIGFITDTPSGAGEDTPVASTFTPSGNISLSLANLWFSFESSKVVIDLNGGKTFTLSGNGCQGKLRFVNESANSIIITGDNCRLDIECTNGVSSVDWNPTTANSGSFFINGELSSLANFPDQDEVRGWIDDKSGVKDSGHNGAFRFWQRNNSGYNLVTVPQYGCDRFQAWGAVGGANFSAITDTNGDNEGFQFTSTSDDVYLSRKTESRNARKLNIPASGTAKLTVAFDALYSANISANNCIVEVFYPSVKDDYTTSELVATNTLSVTTVRQRMVSTFDLPDQSGSGYDYFNGYQVKVTFIYNAGAATISVYEWQDEIGGYATDFEWVDYDYDLKKCQRYYEKSQDLAVDPSTNPTAGRIDYTTQSANLENVPVRFETRKRITPTVALTTSWITAANPTFQGESGFTVRDSSPSQRNLDGHYYADAEIY